MNRVPSSSPVDASKGGGSGGAGLDRRIWTLAWPVIVSLLFLNLVEIVDIAMVARLGRNSVAAVGYAAQYMHLVVTLLESVAIVAVAFIARAIGAGDRDRARAAFAGALGIALTLACVASFMALFFPGVMLGVLGAKPAVAELSTPYLRLVMCSSLLVAPGAIYAASYRARRDTLTPLVAACVMAVVKLSLNSVLIFGALGFPRLELRGAGIATVAAHGAAITFYVVKTALSRDPRKITPGLRMLAARPEVGREVMRVAMPALGERLFMNMGLMAYFALLSVYGEAAIAAYAIGVRLLAVSWIPGVGCSQAAATLVGQALGAGDREEAVRAGWHSVRLALAMMAVIGFICLFLREDLARAFTTDPEILDKLVPFLVTLAVAQPFMGVHFTLSGALRGAGDTWTPMLGSTVGNWVLRVPLAYAFSRMGLDLVWVWGALVGDHVARAVWYLVSFRRGRWARRIGAGIG